MERQFTKEELHQIWENAQDAIPQAPPELSELWSGITDAIHDYTEALEDYQFSWMYRLGFRDGMKAQQQIQKEV